MFTWFFNFTCPVLRDAFRFLVPEAEFDLLLGSRSHENRYEAMFVSTEHIAICTR